MLLRPRQKTLVNRAVEALEQHGNTLAVAPTGAGKTIMLSATIGELSKASTSTIKACVVAHRDELTAQNQAKFCLVNPGFSTSIFDAGVKSWHGNTTFAMVQTLSRESNLLSMPRLDLLVIDEAHHVRAESYLRIISHAQSLNPKLKLLGMTATPNRGDKKGLRVVFSNVCDQITINELIASGHLVRPRTFVMDVGVQEKLKKTKKTAGDYDMEEVALIMDIKPINQAVVSHWKAHAFSRQTVVFCSTINHARHVQQCFIEAGITAVLVHGEMSELEREQTLLAYTTGAAQVIVNVAVLTEGWDHPPTSCIVLLRPSSYKSTFIQMVGRGLRTVNPNDYPGMIKNDCLVLDFGTATLAHGAIEQTADLDDRIKLKSTAPSKSCPECNALVPATVSLCPLCNFVFPYDEISEEMCGLSEEEFVMKEIDILQRSNFKWVPVTDDNHSFMATGFAAWTNVIFKNNQWYAVGAQKQGKAKLLAVGEKDLCFAAANDWMNLYETDDSSHKVKGWLNLPATPAQLGYLPDHQIDYNLTRYKASALMNLKFNANSIKSALRAGGAL